jgi:putative transposase
MKKQMQEENSNPAMQEIKIAMKQTKDLRMYQRYQTILLHLEGLTYDQISVIVNRTPTTIGFYVRAYKTNGLAGLKRGQPSGRPSKLTKEQEQEVYQLIINQRPVDVGFPAEMNWTASLIREWIKRQFSVTYSERGTRDLLYRLRFSYTRPTYTLAKANPELQEAFKREFAATKKNCFLMKLIGSSFKMSP